MTLGDIVKEYRERYGFSMDEFAKKSGLSKGYISMLEKNKNPRTGKPIVPTLDTVQSIAKATGLQTGDLLEMINGEDKHCIQTNAPKKIPVLGSVQAGIPIEAVQEVLDYEEISADMAARGEYFALSVRGASMEPRMREGDVVIVRQQEEVENGETAIVLVNGCDATIKKIGFSKEGIILIPTNPVFETKFYSNQEIKDLPVRILGKVVELRAKF